MRTARADAAEGRGRRPPPRPAPPAKPRGRRDGRGVGRPLRPLRRETPSTNVVGQSVSNQPEKVDKP
eukprot:5638720-Lingulodinium_polyedra.AAC.1